MENIRDSFVSTCNEGGLNADEILSEFLSPDGDPELFWDRVKTNLQAGKLRLIFLADELPVELRRVIEFLNRQMDPTEVIGVEIKQYGGEGFQALTSRTIGRTADTIRQRADVGQRWDEETFFKSIVEHGGADNEALARRLLDWSRHRGLRVWWGRGRLYGSFYSVLDIGDTKYQLFSVWTDSQAEIQFGTLKRRRQFKSDERRLELLRRLNDIPSVQIEEGRIAGYPKIPFTALEPTGHIDQFLEAFEWVISVVESDINASA